MARGPGDTVGVPAPRAAEPARAPRIPVSVDTTSEHDLGLGSHRPRRAAAPGLPRALRPPAGGRGAHRARTRALSAVVVAAAVAALPGCASEGITRGGAVLSDTLTVYSLLPDPRVPAAADMIDGEKLALAQAGGRAGGRTVNFVSLEEGADGKPGDVADAARDVISDTQVIAAIGGLDSAGTRTSAPLF